MLLNGYLDRIGYSHAVRPDLDTLMGIHRAHLLAIPYENLDMHMGCPLTLDLDAIYRKIVENRRGGWCFEMNGLLAWALREIGFEVTMLASSVGRKSVADPFTGDHMILRVDLDRPYLADVGFGDGLFEPIPLAEGSYRQWFMDYHLRLDGDRWWFSTPAFGGFVFDFTLEPYQLSDFAGQSHYLQTSPQSGFTRATVCLRFTPEGLVSLRGAVLRRFSPNGESETVIEDADTYARTLAQVFDLHLEDSAALWDKVWAMHRMREQAKQ